MEIRLDQQETKNADKIKWWKGSFGPQKGELVKSTAQRFSSSNKRHSVAELQNDA
jgi:hypothetical protein